MKLTLNDIVTVAQELIDSQGFDALNMRALAGRLNAEGAALYWHVQNKAELLTLLANGYYRRAFETVQPGTDWPQWLISFGHAFHAELLSHRDAARVCALAEPEKDHAESFMTILSTPLVQMGLSRGQALSCQASVIALTLGWAAYEQSPSMNTFLAKSLNLESSYRHGLAAMVLGLSQSIPSPDWL